MAESTKKEEIIEVLRNLSQRLGHKRLSKQDVAKVLPVSNICYYFGSLGSALEAAGLERTNSGNHFRGRGTKLSDAELFQNLLEIEEEMGREPGMNDCTSRGKFSHNPYKHKHDGTNTAADLTRAVRPPTIWPVWAGPVMERRLMAALFFAAGCPKETHK